MTNSMKKKLYRIYAFLVYLVPMLILFFLRYEKYTNPAGAIGFFGFLIFILITIFFGQQVFEKTKKRAVLVICVILFAFTVATQYIASELLWILGTSIIGAVLSDIVNQVGNVYENYETIVENGITHKNMNKGLPDKKAWAEAYGFIAKNEKIGSKNLEKDS